MLEIRHDDPALWFSNVFLKLVYHFQITLAHRFCNDFAHRNYGVYGLKFYHWITTTYETWLIRSFSQPSGALIMAISRIKE